jgi:hypothetical protein
MGPVRVPKEVGLGKAKITFSFPDWKGGVVQQITYEVSVVDPEPDSKAVVVVQEGKGRTILKGHTAVINSIAVTVDGKMLASADNDGDIRVWATAVAEFVSPFIKSRPRLGHGEKQASALRRRAAHFYLAWKTGRRLFRQGRHAIPWRKERWRFVQRRRHVWQGSRSGPSGEIGGKEAGLPPLFKEDGSGGRRCFLMAYWRCEGEASRKCRRGHSTVIESIGCRG